MSARRRLALITGASDGIGKELALIFAQHGHDLALTARRAERLEALADAIAATGRPRPLVIPCDLARPEGSATLAAALADAGAEVETLVNNAGFGLNGAFAALDGDEQGAMIDLNVRALTELTWRLLPDLRKTRGAILNVASVASYAPGPGMAVYYASKAYVLSFSEALHEELKPDGVRVSALCPGPVATGFQARAGIAAAKLGPGLLSARATAQAGYDGLRAGRRIIVPGGANKGLVAALAYIPHWLLLPRIAARQLGRRSASA